MALTKEQVFSVADEMFADGKAPTLIAIRASLGTGSYSTIAGYLNEWKAASRASVDSAVLVPDELDSIVRAFAAGVWGSALRLASDEFEERKVLVDLELDRLRSDLKEAFVVAEQEQEAANSTGRRNGALEVDLVELRRQLQDRDERIAEMEGAVKQGTASYELLLAKMTATMPGEFKKLSEVVRVPGAKAVVKKKVLGSRK
jgi:hypothetical protein